MLQSYADSVSHHFPSVSLCSAFAVTVVTIPRCPEGSHRVKPKRLDPNKPTKQCNAKHIRRISNEQMSYTRNSSNFDNDDKCIHIYIYIYCIIEGSLEVKLPTIWTVEKQR